MVRRVHAGALRIEQRLHATLPAEGLIPRDIPRVGLEILVRAELRRVDEDAQDHTVGTPGRLIDQREVAIMQKAHGRHQAEAQAFAAPGANL